MKNIYHSLLMLLCLSLAGATQPTAAETLRVGGIGSAAPLVQLLFDEFRKEAPEAELDIKQPPIGTGGALKSLAGGRIDVAFIGRPPKAEEQSGLGRSFELAATPFVFAGATGPKKNGFTLDELAAVYEGKMTHWDDGRPIRPVMRASFESDGMIMKSMSPAMQRAVDVAARRPGMALGQDELDTLALLTRTPGSLGPTTLGLVSSTESRLAVLPINGVTPGIASMKSGTYPWRKAMTVALPAQPAPLADRFVAFLRSEKASAVLLRNDYLPSGK